jgi:5'-3' exonuclease
MRLHLVDGTYELFRAHFSKRPPHVSPEGYDVKATLGLASSMLWLLEDFEEAVTHIAIAFDNPIESFRNDIFEGYKTGAGIEEALVAQFDLAEEAAAALGMVVWSMDRWEADDALATAAQRWRDDVEQVRILTPDKDLGQSVTGTRVVQVDRMRERVIDEAGVRARNGVEPASIPDYLALVGDTADGIPGIPGFGAKTAGTLLSRYSTVEAIPDDVDQWEVKVRGAPKLATTLSRMREEVALYKHLATLVVDVPLAESLEDLEWRGVPRTRFEALCDELGTDSLRSRPSRWAG